MESQIWLLPTHGCVCMKVCTPTPWKAQFYCLQGAGNLVRHLALQQSVSSGRPCRLQSVKPSGASGAHAASLCQLRGCPRSCLQGRVGREGRPGPSAALPKPLQPRLWSSPHSGAYALRPQPCSPSLPPGLQHLPGDIVRFWREEVVFLTSCHLASILLLLVPAPLQVPVAWQRL